MSNLPSPATKIRIRQIALCTEDIWPVETAVAQQLEITPVHRDKPGAPIWMYNSVIAVGNTFLKILQPERASAPTQKFLDKQGGPGGYMLLLQVDDLDAARARAEAADVRIVMDAPKTQIPRRYRCCDSPPPWRHGRGAHIFRLDGGMGQLGVGWPGLAWHQRTDVVKGIVGAEISCANPKSVAERFSEFIGRSVDAKGQMELDESYINFVQGNAEERDRLTAIDMLAADDANRGKELEFARTKIRLV